MSKKIRRRYQAVEFGPLPVEAINRALGTELEPGNVRLGEQAHRHIAEDHPEDYEACMAALPLAIANPTFVGQAPKHQRNFEIVRRVARPDGQAVLVAIGLELNEFGNYAIKSSYLIKAETVNNRRRLRTLRQVAVAVMAQND